MAVIAPSTDPIEKLKELQIWLTNNQVTSSRPEGKRAYAGRMTGGQASSEVAEFCSWVDSIQSQGKS